MKKISTTFGVIPPRAEYVGRFEENCGRTVRIGHGSSGNPLAAGEYTGSEAWDEIHRLMRAQDDWDGPEDKSPETWASSLMDLAGYEWI